MTKIFISGGTGLLGTSIISTLKDKFDLVGTYYSNQIFVPKVPYVKLDLMKKNDTHHIIEEEKPDIVIHTAALTNVDYCEENKLNAKMVNVDGTRNIAEACTNINAKIIYISSDFVFDGKKGNYSEEDEPTPINYYSKTKLDGENVVKDVCSDFLIIRTSIYGWNIGGKSNFATWVINNLEQDSPISAVTDQYSSLMLANDCALALNTLIKLDKKGVFNVASKNRISKFDFAMKLAEILDFDNGLIKPVSSEELLKGRVQRARRPMDVSLRVSRFENETGLQLPTIEEGLKHMKKLKIEGYLSSFEFIRGIKYE